MWCSVGRLPSKTSGRVLTATGQSYCNSIVARFPTFFSLKLQHLLPHPHSQLMTSPYFAEKTKPITRELPYTPQDTSTHELAMVPVYLSAFLLVLIPRTNLSASELTRSTFLFACSSSYVQELSLTYVINLSLSIRSFPSVYKYALMSPILKKEE